jgi:hypothetical protein
MDEQEILFQGEMMLLGWKETHNGGATVTLQLADAGQLDSFKTMTVAKGKVAGQRLAVVMVEIGDDEQPVEQQKGGALSKLAGMWCEDAEFRDWLGVDSAERAAEMIRRHCGITSRAQLDHDPIAAGKFNVRFRIPYRSYLSNELPQPEGD